MSRTAERHRRTLQAYSKLPGNDRCADCDRAAPQWASWSKGVFLCADCAGFHRKMGTHISKVKSLQLDNWTAEQVDSMREGNIVKNALYNPSSESLSSRGLEISDFNMERFVRQKYESQVLKERAPIRPTRSATAAPAPELPVRLPSRTPNEAPVVERPFLAARAQSVPAIPVSAAPIPAAPLTGQYITPTNQPSLQPASAPFQAQQYQPTYQLAPQQPTNPFHATGYMSNSTFNDMQSIQSNLPHLHSMQMLPSAPFQPQASPVSQNPFYAQQPQAVFSAPQPQFGQQPVFQQPVYQQQGYYGQPGMPQTFNPYQQF